ncbi:hypothetical protein POSPLADRAFT_1056007 [Postia placenta MAD-698-R-SB12]|uniref:Uncharacterized protein n=1 Tax=Postia placenta MAD-698-R-SB12 TaxID=670580 RepID=A0A1X6N216_9APHY|nr:hypothetical protein POSPLADRAFT_1056007 [Postia placenta MAD-698-R-SB12]OSX62634.1 hypothetical protein POSPLADRAFT_1056007 [Postia placenta MAD-698-R-SB12]
MGHKGGQALKEYIIKLGLKVSVFIDKGGQLEGSPHDIAYPVFQQVGECADVEWDLWVKHFLPEVSAILIACANATTTGLSVMDAFKGWETPSTVLWKGYPQPNHLLSCCT